MFHSEENVYRRGLIFFKNAPPGVVEISFYETIDGIQLPILEKIRG